MRKYFLIGKRAELRAESDQIAAVAIATVGDYGFTDRFKLQKFPATWSELEFSWYLSPSTTRTQRLPSPSSALITLKPSLLLSSQSRLDGSCSLVRKT